MGNEQPQDNIFAVAQDAQRIAIKIGRAQFAAEVKEIIGTWAVHKPADKVILELQELCRKEAL